MDDRLTGRAVLVTGGASGIGRAVAWQLARAGAHVMIGDQDAIGAPALVAAMAEEGLIARSEPLDVADPGSMRAIVAATVRAFGRLSLAVNCAGIEGTRQPVADYDIDAWRRMIDVNLTGVFLALKYELPKMVRAGGGAIVNVASVLGTRGAPLASAYSAAKHGVIGLTRSAALGYADVGIRVNAVAPGYIDTPMLATLPSAARMAAAARQPLGRLGTADEVADVILFLLSDRARFVTGSVHHVDGGFSAG